MRTDEPKELSPATLNPDANVNVIPVPAAVGVELMVKLVPLAIVVTIEPAGMLDGPDTIMPTTMPAVLVVVRILVRALLASKVVATLLTEVAKLAVKVCPDPAVTPVPEASVNWVALASDATREPAGMVAPLMAMFTSRPAVLVQLTVALSAVVTQFSTETEAAPGPDRRLVFAPTFSVTRMPPVRIMLGPFRLTVLADGVLKVN